MSNNREQAKHRQTESYDVLNQKMISMSKTLYQMPVPWSFNNICGPFYQVSIDQWRLVLRWLRIFRMTRNLGWPPVSSIELLKLAMWSYPVCFLSPEGWQPSLPLFPTHHCQLNSRVCSSGSRLDLCWWLCTAIEFWELFCPRAETKEADAWNFCHLYRILIKFHYHMQWSLVICWKDAIKTPSYPCISHCYQTFCKTGGSKQPHSL